MTTFTFICTEIEYYACHDKRKCVENTHTHTYKNINCDAE